MPRNRLPDAVLALVLSGLLTACSTTKGAKPQDDQMGAAISQPFHDLGVIQATPDEILRRAAKAPYALPPGDACTALAAELRALDAILGPDVDKTAEKPDAAGELVAGAVRSAFSLPFRGVVRRLTGAEQRDRELREAVRAGTARRGFLKGLAHNGGCDLSVAAR